MIAGELGERYRYGQFSSGSDWAERIVASHPVGSQVEVYFAPSDPSDAVLAVGLEGLDLLIFMFLLPFNLVMLAFWIRLKSGAQKAAFLLVHPHRGLYRQQRIETARENRRMVFRGSG